MSLIVFENANVLDVIAGRILPDRHVLLREDRIAEVSETPIKADNAQRFDLKGRTLMPGLCDAHVHVTAVVANFQAWLFVWRNRDRLDGWGILGKPF